MDSKHVLACMQIFLFIYLFIFFFGGGEGGEERGGGNELHPCLTKHFCVRPARLHKTTKCLLGGSLKVHSLLTS